MDFFAMKRKKLQTLCKKHGIPANLKNKDMAEKLSLIYKGKENEDPVPRRLRFDKEKLNVEIIVLDSDSDNEAHDIVAENDSNEKNNMNAEHFLDEVHSSGLNHSVVEPDQFLATSPLDDVKSCDHSIHHMIDSGAAGRKADVSEVKSASSQQVSRCQDEHKMKLQSEKREDNVGSFYLEENNQMSVNKEEIEDNQELHAAALSDLNVYHMVDSDIVAEKDSYETNNVNAEHFLDEVLSSGLNHSVGEPDQFITTSPLCEVKSSDLNNHHMVDSGAASRNADVSEGKSASSQQVRQGQDEPKMKLQSEKSEDNVGSFYLEENNQMNVNNEEIEENQELQATTPSDLNVYHMVDSGTVAGNTDACEVKSASLQQISRGHEESTMKLQSEKSDDNDGSFYLEEINQMSVSNEPIEDNQVLSPSPREDNLELHQASPSEDANVLEVFGNYMMMDEYSDWTPVQFLPTSNHKMAVRDTCEEEMLKLSEKTCMVVDPKECIGFSPNVIEASTTKGSEVDIYCDPTTLGNVVIDTCNIKESMHIEMMEKENNQESYISAQGEVKIFDNSNVGVEDDNQSYTASKKRKRSISAQGEVSKIFDNSNVGVEDDNRSYTASKKRKRSEVEDANLDEEVKGDELVPTVSQPCETVSCNFSLHDLFASGTAGGNEDVIEVKSASLQQISRGQEESKMKLQRERSVDNVASFYLEENEQLSVNKDQIEDNKELSPATPTDLDVHHIVDSDELGNNLTEEDVTNILEDVCGTVDGNNEAVNQGDFNSPLVGEEIKKGGFNNLMEEEVANMDDKIDLLEDVSGTGNSINEAVNQGGIDSSHGLNINNVDLLHVSPGKSSSPLIGEVQKSDDNVMHGDYDLGNCGFGVDVLCSNDKYIAANDTEEKTNMPIEYHSHEDHSPSVKYSNDDNLVLGASEEFGNYSVKGEFEDLCDENDLEDVFVAAEGKDVALESSSINSPQGSNINDVNVHKSIVAKDTDDKIDATVNNLSYEGHASSVTYSVSDFTQDLNIHQKADLDTCEEETLKLSEKTCMVADTVECIASEEEMKADELVPTVPNQPSEMESCNFGLQQLFTLDAASEDEDAYKMKLNSLSKGTLASGDKTIIFSSKSRESSTVHNAMEIETSLPLKRARDSFGTCDMKESINIDKEEVGSMMFGHVSDKLGNNLMEEDVANILEDVCGTADGSNEAVNQGGFNSPLVGEEVKTGEVYNLMEEEVAKMDYKIDLLEDVSRTGNSSNGVVNEGVIVSPRLNVNNVDLLHVSPGKSSSPLVGDVQKSNDNVMHGDYNLGNFGFEVDVLCSNDKSISSKDTHDKTSMSMENHSYEDNAPSVRFSNDEPQVVVSEELGHDLMEGEIVNTDVKIDLFEDFCGIGRLETLNQSAIDSPLLGSNINNVDLLHVSPEISSSHFVGAKVQMSDDNVMHGVDVSCSHDISIDADDTDEKTNMPIEYPPYEDHSPSVKFSNDDNLALGASEEYGNKMVIELKGEFHDLCDENVLKDVCVAANGKDVSLESSCIDSPQGSNINDVNVHKSVAAKDTDYKTDVTVTNLPRESHASSIKYSDSDFTQDLNIHQKVDLDTCEEETLKLSEKTCMVTDPEECIASDEGMKADELVPQSSEMESCNFSLQQLFALDTASGDEDAYKTKLNSPSKGTSTARRDKTIVFSSRPSESSMVDKEMEIEMSLRLKRARDSISTCDMKENINIDKKEEVGSMMSKNKFAKRQPLQNLQQN